MWDRIEPLMPADPVRGRQWADHRRTPEAIAWKYRTNSPWRDLHDGLGSFQTAHKRLIRWSADGTWEKIFTAVLAAADAADDIGWTVSVDSTVARAHQHAAGALKGALKAGASRPTTRSDPPETGSRSPTSVSGQVTLSLKAPKEGPLIRFAEGDAIGDHTVTHPHLTAVSSARVRFELDRAAHDIASVTGHRPTLLRPPFGAYDSRIRALAGQSGLAVVMWSLDPQDWRNISPGTIDRRLLNHVRAGDIVSLHDRYARTLTALPRILTGLASSGFAFVTVPQMLAGSGGTHPGMLYHHGPRA
ncbi:hypothetical protein SCANM63S_05054 [Streptomyces canarius]